MHFDFWSKFVKNLDFGQILRKSPFWSKCAKIFILVEIFENLHFGRNLPEIAFCRNVQKMANSVDIFEKKNPF